MPRTKSFFESRTGTTEDYEEILKQIYGNDSAVVTKIIQNDRGVEQMYGQKFHTEISNDGKLAVRWMETQDTLILSGLMSVEMGINRTQIRDMRNLMKRLEDKLLNGFKLLGTFNSFSWPIIKNMLNRLSKQGHKIIRRQLNVTRLPEGVWTTFLIYVQPEDD